MPLGFFRSCTCKSIRFFHSFPPTFERAALSDDVPTEDFGSHSSFIRLDSPAKTTWLDRRGAFAICYPTLPHIFYIPASHYLFIMKKWCLLVGALGAAAALVAYFSGNTRSSWQEETGAGAGTRGGAVAVAVTDEQGHRRRRRLVLPIPIPASSSTALKMYWEPGYMWQESPDEKRWCMVCRGSCSAGNSIRLTQCDSGTAPTQFLINGALIGPNAMIQAAGTDVCLQANTGAGEIVLANCNSFNMDQWFQGSFGGSRFEIRTGILLDQCLTQEHHPKSGEEVRIYFCNVAREDQTSYWEKY